MKDLAQQFFGTVIGMAVGALVSSILSGCVAVRVVKVEVYAPDEFDIAPVLRDINAEVAP